MTDRRQAGFTLIELSIAVVVLALIIGVAGTVMSSGYQAFEASTARANLNGKAYRALNQIARRLRGAGRASIDPVPQAPFASDSISFQEVSGWTIDGVSWSSDTAIRLEYEPGELDNEQDDDNDGLIDECQVVLVKNLGQPDESSIVLVTGVREYLEGEVPDGVDNNGNGLQDERGLCFQLVERGLRLRISVSTRVRSGAISTRTLETTVALRN